MTKVYSKPTVEKVGSFESVTKSTGTGASFDAAFPFAVTPQDFDNAFS